MSLDVQNELWLSEEEEEEEEEGDGYTDPKSFSLDLTHQGPSGDFRTRNRPGQRQRVVVSNYARRYKPAYQFNCEAKAMIHGRWGGAGPDADKWATLLVYEFEFHSYRGRRLKAADIRFRFEPMPGKASEVFVAGIRPNGVFKVEQTQQSEHTKTGLNLSLGSQPLAGAVSATLSMSSERDVEKVTAHHTVITGDTPKDIYGDRYEAHFALAENRSQEDGIPTRLVTCILLKRRTEEDDFVCLPFIEVTPDFKSMIGELTSSREKDDPIWFDPSEPAFNQLQEQGLIDQDNLGATPLDQLWDYSMYATRAEMAKAT